MEGNKMSTESTAEMLRRLGFQPDGSLVAASTEDHMTYAHFNGSTLAYDDEGGAWTKQGITCLSPEFRLREVEVVE